MVSSLMGSWVRMVLCSRGLSGGRSSPLSRLKNMSRPHSSSSSSSDSPNVNKAGSGIFPLVFSLPIAIQGSDMLGASPSEFVCVTSLCVAVSHPCPSRRLVMVSPAL
jgi:hypothetical protein